MSNTNYMSFILGLTGVICNLLSICVFSRKKLKQHSFPIYWQTRSIFDIIFLTIFSILYPILNLLKFESNGTSSLFCLFDYYLPYFINETSLLLESLITFDRFVIIVLSNKNCLKKQMKKRSVQIGLILALIAYSLLTNITNTRKSYCFDNKWLDDMILFAVILVLIKAVVLFFLVIIVNPILCFLIISRILSNRTPNQLSSTVLDRKFAISAISLNFKSLVLRVMFNGLSFLYLNFPSEKKSIILSIIIYVSVIDKISIFLINMLVNSVFRQEFLSLIGCYKSTNSTNSESVERMNTNYQREQNDNSLLPVEGTV